MMLETDSHKALEKAGGGTDVGVNVREDVEELAQAEDDTIGTPLGQLSGVTTELVEVDGPDEALIKTEEEATEGGCHRAEDEKGRGEQVLHAAQKGRSVLRRRGSSQTSRTETHFD